MALFFPNYCNVNREHDDSTWDGMVIGFFCLQVERKPFTKKERAIAVYPLEITTATRILTYIYIHTHM